MASRFHDFPKLFPTPDNATKEVLVKFYAFTLYLALNSVIVEFYVSIVGIILTTFHLIILTRKAMRTSSIISIMTAAAICDMVSMIEAMSVEHIVVNLAPKKCSPPLPLHTYQLFCILQTVRDLFVRCSTWLSVSMALIRFLVLKFAVKRNLNIYKFSYGFRVFRVSLAISTVFSIFYFFKRRIVQVREWSPAESCGVSAAVVTRRPVFETHFSEFFTAHNNLFLRVFMFFNGTASKILPCIMFPLLTILLILELRKARKRKKSLSCLESTFCKNNTERTTALVIFMTVTFFIALIPSGIVTSFQAFYTDVGFLYMSTYVDNVCHGMLTFNAILHFFICYALSSQYRKTVRVVLRIPDGRVGVG